MAKKVTTKKINSDNLFYHFMQNYVLNDGQPNNDFERQFLENLIINLSVWFPVEWFKNIPVILPYVIRKFSRYLPSLAKWA